MSWCDLNILCVILVCSIHEHTYANIDCLRWSKNYHVHKNCAKRVDTFDVAFGDNRISVTSNDVYRLIRCCPLWRRGDTVIHEGHRVIDTSWLARSCIVNASSWHIWNWTWIVSESTFNISPLFLNELMFKIRVLKYLLEIINSDISKIKNSRIFLYHNFISNYSLSKYGIIQYQFLSLSLFLCKPYLLNTISANFNII